jgi:glycosyltransferase involved in cell wall biosynthesis
MGAKSQNNITAVIIAKNESVHIERSVSSAFQVAKEVIVIDTGSSDDTPEKAKKLGARVIEIEWRGFGHAKNYGQQIASNDWIISIDADEYLSQSLIDTIQTLPLTKGVAYKFNRLTSINGVWIKHSGWHPDWVVRLYEKKIARWSSDPIHEKLIWSETPKYYKLKGIFYHESFKTRDDHQIKAKKYASLNGTKLYQAGIKANFYMLHCRPILKFLKTVIIHRCFLDGAEGWYIAFSNFKLKRLEAQNLQQLWKNQ